MATLEFDLTQRVDGCLIERIELEGKDTRFCLFPGCDSDLAKCGYIDKNIIRNNGGFNQGNSNNTNNNNGFNSNNQNQQQGN